MNKNTYFQDWGVVDYQEAWDKQEVLFNELMETKKAKRTGEIVDYTNHYVVLVEHPHVYTLGKSGSQNNLLINAIQLKANNATFVTTNRGGDITYHGPGQIVGYPILDLEELGLGLKQYIHMLEDSIINTLAEYNISATRLDGATGVWLDIDTKNARKICAIGVKSSRFVTMHGFALNVNTQLDYFNYINPCGFIDKGVTSIQNELGYEIDFDECKNKVKANIEKVFDFKLV